MIFLIILLFLLVGGAMTLLAIQNLSLTIKLSFLLWQTPEIPVGLLVLGAFLVGALLLYLVSVISALQDRRLSKKTQKRVKELEVQNELLRKKEQEEQAAQSKQNGPGSQMSQNTHYAQEMPAAQASAATRPPLIQPPFPQHFPDVAQPTFPQQLQDVPQQPFPQQPFPMQMPGMSGSQHRSTGPL